MQLKQMLVKKQMIDLSYQNKVVILHLESRKRKITALF